MTPSSPCRPGSREGEHLLCTVSAPSRFIPLATALLLFCCLRVYAIGQFEKGTRVRLNRPETLSFKSDPYRQGRVGEEFTVLQYGQANLKVFVLSIDLQGKPIALNAPQSAFDVVPGDPTGSFEEVFAKVRAKRLQDALRLLTITHPEAESLKAAIQGLSTAVSSFDTVRAMESSVREDVARRKRNAQTINHVNPLTGDTSAMRRAEKIQEEAEQIWERREQGVQAAEDALRTALANAKSVDFGSINRDKADQLQSSWISALEGLSKVCGQQFDSTITPSRAAAASTLSSSQVEFSSAANISTEISDISITPLMIFIGIVAFSAFCYFCSSSPKTKITCPHCKFEDENCVPEATEVLGSAIGSMEITRRDNTRDERIGSATYGQVTHVTERTVDVPVLRKLLKLTYRCKNCDELFDKTKTSVSRI